MKLMYRGVAYEYTPANPSDDTGLISPQELTPLPAACDGWLSLKFKQWRLAAQQRQQARLESSFAAQPPILRQGLPRLHQFNLQRNLERRLRSAKAQRNLSLMYSLEVERRQLLGSR